jgi:phosphoadenylyl-sulfate reductase (thioredoxin)
VDRGGRVDGEAEARAARLNAAYAHHSAFAVMSRALDDPKVGEIALVSSFGAESVVLLHMLSVMDRRRPVLFLETGMLFPETLAYQRDVAGRLGLADVRLIRPDAGAIAADDPDGTLHARDADACCAIRKARPLEAALAPFDAWITGRKRFQGGARAGLQFFEADGPRLKVNPLAHWTQADVADYMINNRLPRHPLVARGYPSLGCAPCTTPVAAGEDPRAGRWRGAEKEECGIHFVDGRLVRGPVPAPPAAEEVPAEETEMTDTSLDATRIARDDGFAPDDWTGGFVPAAGAPEGAPALDLTSDADPAALAGRLDGTRMIRVDFPSFADGRGFTVARRLRQMGYRGRLRARGVIADQYAMARRSGFDEVEVPPALAARQPEPQWRARADWRAHDYRARLRA